MTREMPEIIGMTTVTRMMASSAGAAGWWTANMPPIRPSASVRMLPAGRQRIATTRGASNFATCVWTTIPAGATGCWVELTSINAEAVKALRVFVLRQFRYRPGALRGRGSRRWPPLGDTDRGQGMGRAIQGCQSAVIDRMQNNGYRNINVRSIRMDDGPGRTDFVVGNGIAQRGRGNDPFQFSCRVDARDGDVRSVDIR